MGISRKRGFLENIHSSTSASRWILVGSDVLLVPSYRLLGFWNWNLNPAHVSERLYSLIIRCRMKFRD
ncbi:hypothetical protein L2E82_32363 [Cichorium intybus]|uniref:Uncharacterized protein n=1 Tax=Cichorium intybus TaxID=13427 RepID=A0ACB9BG74_CICIN|nr:hypothetical protein L2E82_32363 [Cichorium intybus]